VIGPISYGNSENYHLFLKQLTRLYEKKDNGNKLRIQMQTIKLSYSTSIHCIPKSLTYCTGLDRGEQQIGSEQVQQ